MIRVYRLSVASLLLIVMMGIVGCGGADQTTNGPVKPDENAAQRQKEMNDFYKTNPLPKPKAKR